MEPSYVYRAVVDKVIDGDTYELTVDLGFRCANTFEGRLHGVNCKERNTDEGKKAKKFVEDLMPPGSAVVVKSFKDERTFARWVVDVWLPSGENLGEKIVSSGYGEVLSKWN